MEEANHEVRLSELEHCLTDLDGRFAAMAAPHDGLPHLTAALFDMMVERGALEALRAYQQDAGHDRRLALEVWSKLMRRRD